MQVGHQSQAKWVLEVDALVDCQVARNLGGRLSEANQVVVGGELVRVKGEGVEA